MDFPLDTSDFEAISGRCAGVVDRRQGESDHTPARTTSQQDLLGRKDAIVQDHAPNH